MPLPASILQVTATVICCSAAERGHSFDLCAGVTLQVPSKPSTVADHEGAWQGGGQADAADLEVLRFFQVWQGPVARHQAKRASNACGDFMLRRCGCWTCHSCCSAELCPIFTWQACHMSTATLCSLQHDTPCGLADREAIVPY